MVTQVVNTILGRMQQQVWRCAYRMQVLPPRGGNAALYRGTMGDAS